MAKIHQIIELEHTATINIEIHKKVYFRGRGNIERTSMINKKNSKINKRYKTGPKPTADITTINIPPPNHHSIYVKVTDTKHKIYTYQTSGFPFTLVRGHKYLMIICEVDTNAILAEPIKTKLEKGKNKHLPKKIQQT